MKTSARLRFVIHASEALGLRFGRFARPFVTALAAAILSTAFAQLAWTSVDIGAAAAAGSSSEAEFVHTVRGSGADIWDRSDAFHFRYVPWSGDGVFIVRVTSLTPTHPWAKAGIMIRPNLSANAPHVFAVVNPDQIASRIFRPNAGDDSQIEARLADSDRFMPMWLKLTREGTTIAAHFSRDGTGWTSLGQGVFAFPENVLVGLAVSSHADGTLATGTFDRLRFMDNAPGTLTAVARAPNRIDLAWTYTTPTATAIEVERAPDSLAELDFVRIATLPGNALSYSDTVSAATTYFYRVRALAPSGPSGYTNVASAFTFGPAPPGWVSEDIGATAVGGRTTEADGTFFVAGSGAGVGRVDLFHVAQGRGDLDYEVIGYSDEFHFAYKPWTGNGEVVARFTGASGPEGSQAGVMVRSSTDPSALSVFYHVRTGGFGVAVLSRPGTASDPRFRNESVINHEVVPGSPPPNWLKLVRDGTGVMSYASSDGVNWSELVWVRSLLPNEVLLGLAVSGTQNGDPVTGELPAVAVGGFDHVRVGAVTTPVAPPPAPTALSVTSVGTDRIVLAWQNNTLNYDAVEVERSTDGVAYTRLTFGDFQGTTYTDFSRPAGTTFYYRVRLTRGTQVSGYSNTVSATTLGIPAPPSGLTAQATSSTQVVVNWVDNSATEEFFQLWRSTDGVTFAARAAVPANFTTFVDNGVSPTTTYYYRVRAISGGGDSAFSNTASVTTPPGSWQAQDMGNVAVPGSMSEAKGVLTVRGSGEDIWGTGDEFHYVYQPWNGDGEITVRLDSLTPTNPWAKAGVMFRETLTAGSRHVLLAATPAHGIALQARLTVGGESTHRSSPYPGALPVWLRLVRTGTTFTAFQSEDGASWDQVGTETLGLPPGIHVGIAVTSHDDGVLATATFASVSVSGATPPPDPVLPAAPSGLTATAISSTRIDLGWTDNASDETHFRVERSTDNVTFGDFVDVAANSTAYSDEGLTAGTTYYYRVLACRVAVLSAPSNAASATTLAAPPPDGVWKSQDVGPVGVTGMVREAGGVVHLSGSGVDIWDNVDSFRFHQRTWTGDGEFVARVSDILDTDSWAKAGLMFRETLESGSRHVFVAITPRQGTVFQHRLVTHGSSSSTSGSGAKAPRWLKLTRSGSTFAGYESADGVAWMTVGTVTLDLPATLFAGLAVTSHNNAVLTTAGFDAIRLSGDSIPPPPGAWEQADIGVVGVAGSNAADGNTITIRGSGIDIWDTVDGFRFVYRQMTGDAEVEAQVASLGNTHPWAKAGVMIRESTAAGARNVFAYLTPGNGAAVQARSTTGEATAFHAGPWVTPPSWVRLVRRESRITAYFSPDGITWTQSGAYEVPMGSTVLVGFAVTSHDHTQLNTAVFVDPFIR